MAYRFERGESVEAGLRRIAREELYSAIREIGDRSFDRHEAAHQVRKRCKRVRGLLRFIRPGLGATFRLENDWFRDRARELSRARDAGAMVEAFDALAKARRSEAEDMLPLRLALTQRRDRLAESEEGLAARLAALSDSFRGALARTADWRLECDGESAVAGGWRKTYRRCRRGMRRAYETRELEAFHEWRKRVKYHGYHARLVEGCWRPELEARAGELKRLGDLLGDEHDLALLRDVLRLEPELARGAERLERFVALIDGRRSALQSEAQLVGQLVFAQKPGASARRLAASWRAWRRESPQPSEVIETSSRHRSRA